MKKCQFCAEEVKDEAIKCKHCGSMLIATPIDPMKATDPAKAVTKGLKQKQLHDSLYKMWGALTVIVDVDAVKIQHHIAKLQTGS